MDARRIAYPSIGVVFTASILAGQVCEGLDETCQDLAEEVATSWPTPLQLPPNTAAFQTLYTTTASD